MLSSLLHGWVVQGRSLLYICFLLSYFVVGCDGWMRWRDLDTCLDLALSATSMVRYGCGGDMFFSFHDLPVDEGWMKGFEGFEGFEGFQFSVVVVICF